MAKKCLLILLDGLGDRSYESFDYQTPLQAANTPVLDSLSKIGANGLYHAAMQGQALPSENAHFSMFGYEKPEFPGRGALEALGAGIHISHQDVAVLSHFVSLTESEGLLILDENKPQLSEDEIQALTDAIREYESEDIRIRFNPTGGIRGIITLNGDVLPFITDSDPFAEGIPIVDILPWNSYKEDMAVQKTAAALKDYLVWVYHVLKDHPVNLSRKKKGPAPINGLVTQRAGQLKMVPSFKQRYGLSGLSMASGMVYWGLSKYIGMDIQKVTDTDNPGQDIAERLNLAFESFQKYDFIHVHTKTPDEAAHTKKPLAKKRIIESLDAGIGEGIAPILNDPDILVVVTADHSTPCSGPLIHSGESVPVMFIGEGVRRDNISAFDEISAAGGALGTLRGKELLYMILNHLDRAKLMGIMDTPIDHPYWPGQYKSFKIR